MNITNIQTSQISQNVISLGEKRNLKGENRPVTPSAQTSSAGSAIQSVESRTTLVQPSGITAGISYLQDQLDELLISYPPFFPLGTYQRSDLIKKVKGIQEDVQKSSIDAGLKQKITAEKLTVDATDQEISTALDKLFTLRDTLVKDKPVSSGIAQPGSILDIKV